MTKQDIAEKYGVELIGKEMWVWDEDKNNAKFVFVIYKETDNEANYPYQCLRVGYENASDTNPNDVQVGESFQKLFNYLSIELGVTATQREMQDIVEIVNLSNDNNAKDAKEPKVGDKGYFWDNDKVSYAYSTLKKIDNTPIPFCSDYFDTWFRHFSTEKQPWMQ